MYVLCCLMIRRPPRSTRTDTLVPYTTLFRSEGFREAIGFLSDDGFEQFELAAEVDIESASGATDALYDVVDGCSGKALLVEEASGGIDQPASTKCPILGSGGGFGKFAPMATCVDFTRRYLL